MGCKGSRVRIPPSRPVVPKAVSEKSLTAFLIVGTFVGTYCPPRLSRPPLEHRQRRTARVGCCNAVCILDQLGQVSCRVVQAQRRFHVASLYFRVCSFKRRLSENCGGGGAQILHAITIRKQTPSEIHTPIVALRQAVQLISSGCVRVYAGHGNELIRPMGCHTFALYVHRYMPLIVAAASQRS